MYANAKTFFQAKEKSMRDIECIMGNMADTMGDEVAAAAIGKGLEDILEKISSTMDQRIVTTVKKAMDQYPPSRKPQTR